MAGQSTNMDQGVRGWIFSTARSNLWRVSSHIDLADLVQDGWLVWHRVCVKYPNVTQQKHRMALFKTAFTNHIHDLSKKKSRLEVFREADLAEEFERALEGIDPSSDPDLGFVITQLPRSLKRLLQRAIETDSPHRPRYSLTSKLHTRETTNERLCRLAGLDPAKRNVHTAIIEYLAGGRLHPQYD